MGRFQSTLWPYFIVPSLFLALAPGSAFAIQTTASPVQASPASDPSSPLDDIPQMEAFLDGIMAAQMPARSVPAVSLSVVRNGEIIFAKGYGFADRAEWTPVTADRTLFRPGSISKLFTWTAVMQLFEQGKLELDRNVNEYVTQFQIPDTFPEPITMEHLLTHTPGFEDGGLGYLFVREEEKIVPLADSLAAHIPMRVRPPGTYSSYSNWGTALAGLIVANISGQKFEDYIEEHILRPLEMDHSTFHEPLPPNLAPDMAVGYSQEAGLYKSGHFELISNFGPAGALSATATDMANFMIAHLQLGQFKEQRILSEETARLMYSQLYTPDPRLPGMAHGFYHSRLNSQHVIGHGGDTAFFHSNLALLPEQGLGVYVSYVTNGGMARIDLMQAFADRYFPQSSEPLPELAADFAERGKRFTGNYRFTRHNWSTIEKLTALGSTLAVSLSDKNRLVVTGFIPPTSHWVEIGDRLFQQLDSNELMAFEEDSAGNITHLSLGMLPFMPAYRLSWYQSTGFNLSLVALGLLFSLTVPLSALIRRKENHGSPGLARWSIRLGIVTGLLTLLFFFGFGAGIAATGNDLMYGIPTSLKAVLLLPMLLVLLTIPVALLAAGLWVGSHWSFGRRLHYSLFAISLVGLCWFYNYWNILGFRY